MDATARIIISSFLFRRPDVDYFDGHEDQYKRRLASTLRGLRGSHTPKIFFGIQKIQWYSYRTTAKIDQHVHVVLHPKREYNSLYQQVEEFPENV